MQILTGNKPVDVLVRLIQWPLPLKTWTIVYQHKYDNIMNGQSVYKYLWRYKFFLLYLSYILAESFSRPFQFSTVLPLVSTRFGTFFGTFNFGVFGTHIKRLVPPCI
jgi:hypothetical protein